MEKAAPPRILIPAGNFLQLAVLLLSAWLLNGCSAGSVDGQLVDYRTDAPISGATVTVTRSGWGPSNGQLVWDKRYSASTRTDSQGRFSIGLPGPVLLVGTGPGRLSAEAAGYQRLSEVEAPAGAHLRLQTVPQPARSVPGGIAAIGYYADGKPFGWNFVENRPTEDAEQADIFPLTIRRSPLGLTLAAHPQGGLRFISQTEQGIAVASYGHLLRYVDEAPADAYTASLTLAQPGTLFVRTRHGRYAKLAFDPMNMSYGSGSLAGTERPAEFALYLQFAYNPLTGRELPFDSLASGGRVEPVFAAIAADVPEDGMMPKIARSYRIEVRDEAGQLLDRLQVRLEPGVPRKLPGCLPAGDPNCGYENLELIYGADGLPHVRFSITGREFVFHASDHLVGRHKATVVEFHDYIQARAIRRELRLQEVEDRVDENAVIACS